MTIINRIIASCALISAMGVAISVLFIPTPEATICFLFAFLASIIMLFIND
tara:strand:+ start:647 stop:799 length:153 start_codon:yes stop_codon:yes gene_type:complete